MPKPCCAESTFLRGPNRYLTAGRHTVAHSASQASHAPQSPPPIADFSSLRLSLLSTTDACCLLCSSEGSHLNAEMSLHAQLCHRWSSRHTCAGALPLTDFNVPSPSAWSQRRPSTIVLGSVAWQRGSPLPALTRQSLLTEPWWRSRRARADAMVDCGSGIGQRHHARSASCQHRRAAAAAAARAEAAVEDEGLEAVAREVEAALPQYCTGCGIRLQRDDPDAPG